VIHVKRPPTPDGLKSPGSAGVEELAKVRDFFAKAANRKRSYAFKAYKADSVKLALEQAFHGKCAYCEAIYADMHPVDIEHFRPKAGFVTDGGDGSPTRLETPGYWWLAMKWKNLLPSCIDCNRARTQQFENAPPHVSGKANQFPITDEARRARNEGDERREGRLLLDPCTDHPENHLVFDDEGHVDPARDSRNRMSKKGRKSIEVYGLDRDAKIRGRRRVRTYLELAIKKVRLMAEQVDSQPGNPRWEQELAAARKDLEAFAEPEQEFAGMCRQAIDRFERSLIG
jgi:uncharacterized protein (TIGR02646 family)